MNKPKKSSEEFSRIQEQLQAADARYKLLFERSLSPIAVTDKHFDFKEVNQAFCDMLGYTEAELMALSMPNISVKESGDKSIFLIKKMIDGELDQFVISKKYLHKDGSIVSANTAVRALHDRSGNYDGSIASIQEITLEQLRNMEASNQALKTFAYSVAHDLQSPLKNIESLAEVLQSSQQLTGDENSNEMLDLIQDSANRMSRLISEILEAALASNSMDLDTLLDLNLNDILVDVLANLNQVVTSSQAVIVVEDLGVIKGRYADFVQLFQNFIANSIKYARPFVPPEVHVSAKTIDGGLEFTIQDNGRGIPDILTKDVLNSFVRGTALQESGHGIGLATCRKIIHTYGGEISLTSVADQGTCITFSLQDGSKRHAKSA